MAPDDSSTPLQTMSYWNALISSGSCPFSASRPPWGIENGLWLNSIFPVLSSSSYIGKSVIQQKRNVAFSSRYSSRPIRSSGLPASFAAAPGLSEATKTVAGKRGREGKRVDISGNQVGGG